MSVIFATEPLWATAFASVLLGEKLGPQAAVGAGFIVAACLTAQGPKVREMHCYTVLLLCGISLPPAICE
jgi:drug/metabolite transporter (DMT)-like permease